MPIVDVIVPVYRGAETTRRCLETLLAAPNRTPVEVIVVNDASPDPEIARYVRELAQRRRVTLVEQPTQQGFAAAINRAVALHRERDVVVLHSDAEVANDWLDRLSAHALARDAGAMEGMADDSIWGPDKINVPVLAIMAKLPFYPPNIEELSRPIAPNLDFQMWEGVGHFLMMEKPKQFNDAVIAFLNKNSLLK